MQNILTINPGAISTKCALFKLSDGNLKLISYEKIEHDSVDLKKYEKLIDQIPFRKDSIIKFSKKNKVKHIHCIVSRGGLLRSVQGGNYIINSKMLTDLTCNRYGKHASNLGALIAYDLKKVFKCPIMITDPVSVDEFGSLARYSGVPTIKRKAQSHALNIRAVARLASKKMNLDLKQANFVIAHLGSGFSIVPFKQGKIVDANNANDGGPFSVCRAGSLPITQLVDLAFSGKYQSSDELIRELTHHSGCVAYLGIDNGGEIIKRVLHGDRKAETVLRAMAYQISKEIGAMATVLKGKVKAIIMTGGLARPPITDWINSYTKWIAPMEIYADDQEQNALAEAGMRYLLGNEKLKEY